MARITILGLVLSACLVGSVGHAGSAIASAQPPEPGRAIQLQGEELFGLRIGTTAQQAQRLLEKRGFQLRQQELGDSWYAMVGREAGTIVRRPQRKAVTASQFNGPGGELVALHFVQTPLGTALSRIQVQFPATASPETMQAAIALQAGSAKCDVDRCWPATLAADPGARSIILDASAKLKLIEAQSVTEAIATCGRLRLGLELPSGYNARACG
jgi:hypothetical protein